MPTASYDVAWHPLIHLFSVLIKEMFFHTIWQANKFPGNW